MLIKVCTKCGVEKSVDYFAKQNQGKYGVRSNCKSCDSQRIAHYRACNKKVVVEQQKTYYAANKEAIAEQQKAYYVANKEAISERMKAYRAANTHLFNTYCAKRKAAKLQATPQWANKEHIESLYLIASLNKEAGINLHVDHIVPLQSDVVCGLHCEANLQLLPSSDNISKGNRWWPDMW